MSEVLVVGTVHLAQLGRKVESSDLADLRDRLDRFRPTVVCVEHLPARDIDEMDALGGTWRAVAEMFASDDVRLARIARDRLRRSRIEAVTTAEGLLGRAASLAPAERRELVANLLAAGELPTAVLQWSLLPPAERRGDPFLPEEVVDFLGRAVASANEIYSLAVPVARKAGLARLVSVDSQWDGARILQESEAALEEAFGHPLHRASRDVGLAREQGELTDRALAGGGFLPLYRFLNTPGYGWRDAVSQWEPWLRTGLASGVDRLRFANWESRNASIVANVSRVTASTRSERVLLLIGAAHKPFLEELLGRLAHVRVVPFSEISCEEGGGGDATGGVP